MTLKRSALKRMTPLRSRPKLRAREPGRAAWKESQRGFCPVCHRPCWHLARHHVLLEQIVRREGADPWALRNSMLLCPDCHVGHHSGFRKIPLELVPEEALAFAVDVLGEARAADYFRRRYGVEEG